EIAGGAHAEEALNLFLLVEWSNDANLAWAVRILEALPIQDLLSKPESAALLLPQLLAALVPYRQRKTSIPRATIQRVLKQFVSVAELDVGARSREWSVLTASYPREFYDLVRERIAHRASLSDSSRYQPVPHGYPVGFHLAALAKDPDYPTISDELWNRVN